MYIYSYVAYLEDILIYSRVYVCIEFTTSMPKICDVCDDLAFTACI